MPTSFILAVLLAVPCYGDPSLPKHYAIRDLKTHALPPVILGARWPEMADSVAKELENQVAGYSKVVSWKRALEGDENQNQDPPVGPMCLKRTWLSADKCLALPLKN
ncbi:hypothetical protein K438DRAFT_242210 [Mycena galopus ATCC 62051]|nr:hypothetical protein K438DRAFT_242210 [Mycena galopus ATCC 62051]